MDCFDILMDCCFACFEYQNSWTKLLSFTLLIFLQLLEAKPQSTTWKMMGIQMLIWIWRTIKWKNWSHMHNTWESETTLHEMKVNGLKKLKNFKDREEIQHYWFVY